MTDTQFSPDSDGARAAPSSAVEAPHTDLPAASAASTDTPRRGRFGLLYLLVLLLAGLMAWQWWAFRMQVQDLRAELAQRLRSVDSLSQQTKTIVDAAQDAEKELRAKVNVLESKQTAAQGQQLALEQLYQDLSKNRDDWALAEIEQVLSTASQQLQLAGNVAGALIALQNADKNLSREEKPQFIAIRRAIANDIEALKSVPNVDITGIALRLDSAIAQVDNLRLLADARPLSPAQRPRAANQPGSTTPAPAPALVRNADGSVNWLPWLQAKWHGVSSDIWHEVRELVQVRTVTDPEALLLSPSQAYYVRENLKIRLLSARLALLSHNETSFHGDLTAAQDIISRYFDTNARQTQVLQALLRQVQQNDLSIKLPTLAESIKAVRDYKANP